MRGDARSGTCTRMSGPSDDENERRIPETKRPEVGNSVQMSRVFGNFCSMSRVFEKSYQKMPSCSRAQIADGPDGSDGSFFPVDLFGENKKTWNLHL